MPSLPLVKHTMAAATTARTLVKQAMKPHIPMIKFPRREGKGSETGHFAGNPNSLDALVTKVTPKNTASSSTTKAKTKGPLIDSSELPVRFQRKPISSEEMEFIEKGGQV